VFFCKGWFEMLKSAGLATTLVFGLATGAHAATVNVDALANSSGGGVGLATGVILAVGQFFSVTADVLDTWSLGPNDPGCTRESNADGLIPTPCYSTYTQGNLNALYGTLVGQIGVGGDFFVVGSVLNANAGAAGELFLYNWDSDFATNSGSIAATISTVPLPAAGLLLLGALAGLGALRRRKAI
jgi:hypothetical protein